MNVSRRAHIIENNGCFTRYSILEELLMEKNIRSVKLPIKVKLGYGLGTVGDSIPYTLFFSYFIFYLTNYVGMAPGLAGIISFLAVLWNAVAGPIVGYLSDNSKNPKGRRRPLLIAVIVPYALIIILSYAPFSFTGTAAFIYYLIMAMLFQTGYAAWKGPWDALGGRADAGLSGAQQCQVLSIPVRLSGFDCLIVRPDFYGRTVSG